MGVWVSIGISGGHINPAVSTARFLSMQTFTCIVYEGYYCSCRLPWLSLEKSASEFFLLRYIVYDKWLMTKFRFTSRLNCLEPALELLWFTSISSMPLILSKVMGFAPSPLLVFSQHMLSVSAVNSFLTRAYPCFPPGGLYDQSLMFLLRVLYNHHSRLRYSCYTRQEK